MAFNINFNPLRSAQKAKRAKEFRANLRPPQDYADRDLLLQRSIIERIMKRARRPGRAATVATSPRGIQTPPPLLFSGLRGF
jgi:hypothetical protein